MRTPAEEEVRFDGGHVLTGPDCALSTVGEGRSTPPRQ
jgi:hypothetical protein